MKCALTSMTFTIEPNDSGAIRTIDLSVPQAQALRAELNRVLGALESEPLPIPRTPDVARKTAIGASFETLAHAAAKAYP